MPCEAPWSSVCLPKIFVHFRTISFRQQKSLRFEQPGCGKWGIVYHLFREVYFVPADGSWYLMKTSRYIRPRSAFSLTIYISLCEYHLFITGCLGYRVCGCELTVFIQMTAAMSGSLLWFSGTGGYCSVPPCLMSVSARAFR